MSPNTDAFLVPLSQSTCQHGHVVSLESRDFSLQESVIQAEYKEAIKADTIKGALRRTLGILLDGDIDFAAEIRFQGTAFVHIDE